MQSFLNLIQFRVQISILYFNYEAQTAFFFLLKKTKTYYTCRYMVHWLFTKEILVLNLQIRLSSNIK